MAVNTSINPPVRHIRQGTARKLSASKKRYIKNDYFFFFSMQLKEEVEAVANDFRRMKRRKLSKSNVAFLIEKTYELTVPLITLKLLMTSRTPRSYLVMSLQADKASHRPIKRVAGVAQDYSGSIEFVCLK